MQRRGQQGHRHGEGRAGTMDAFWRCTSKATDDEEMAHHAPTIGVAMRTAAPPVVPGDRDGQCLRRRDARTCHGAQGHEPWRSTLCPGEVRRWRCRRSWMKPLTPLLRLPWHGSPVDNDQESHMAAADEQCRSR
jgi:hypothetical protein